MIAKKWHNDAQTNKITGLTNKEVTEQKRLGNCNITTTAPKRSAQDIIKANFLTPFNALNFGLLLLVLIAGKPLNATFAFVLLFNTLIGTFQELRAKQKLDKLAVLNNEEAIVLREKTFITIPVTEIVLGDIIKFDAGKQIVVDGFVCGESAEIDESLLTGEADPILKKENDAVYSGSFVVAGSFFMQATKVGDDIYANKLASEAKNFSLAKSELGNAMRKIIKIVSWLILPIGLLLLSTQIIGSGSTWQNAVVNAVAGIVGMIPEGLVLLTTVAFMVGSIRLSKKQTLVQELPAIESLARVNVLCLDKTGTLTEGSLKYKKMIIMNQEKQADIEQALGGLVKYLPAANATQIALQERFNQTTWLEYNAVPFSSARKWSGVTFKEQGSWILGAADILFPKEIKQYANVISLEQEIGNRVLALAYTDATLVDEQLPTTLTLQAFIVFKDIIRENAPTTLEYFAKQDVAVKIISGDHPITVAAIAHKVGLAGSEKWIDAQTLPEDIETLQTFVKEYTVFGRVTPKQKQHLIMAMQANGDTVGMTGDGVNDVLALKQADCSIAMASGSEATRTVSQLVLMNSDFASLPLIVNEGRKVINNIERVASLYLVKTLYSTILSLIFIILMKPYPFEPIQLSIISALMVGIPTFFLALEANTNKVSGSFLDNVFQKTIPAALGITTAVLSVYLLQLFLPISHIERITMTFLVLGGMQFFILYNVSKPMRIWKILLLSLIFSAFMVVSFNPIANLYLGLIRLPWIKYLIPIGILAIIYSLFSKISTKIIKTYEKNRERIIQLFLK